MALYTWLVWFEHSRVVAGAMASSVRCPSWRGVRNWSAKRDLWWCRDKLKNGGIQWHSSWGYGLHHFWEEAYGPFCHSPLLRSMRFSFHIFLGACWGIASETAAIVTLLAERQVISVKWEQKWWWCDFWRKEKLKTSANNYKDPAKFSVTLNSMSRQTGLYGLGVNCLTCDRYLLISWMKKMQWFGNFGDNLSLAAKQNHYEATGPNLDAHCPTFWRLENTPHYTSWKAPPGAHQWL